MTALELHGVSRSFGPVRGIEQISLTAGRGELIGLLGPNGAGKTTLLRVLATLLPPTAGTIRVGGFDPQEAPAAARRQIGYLPESLPNIPEARVESYLHYRAQLKDIPAIRRRAEVDRCLGCCDLLTVRRRILGNLSHGFRRRVHLAEALLGDPPTLLLDEPTIGLDPLQIQPIRTVLRELAAEHTLLLSTHLLAEAELLCSRALLLSQGRLIEDLPLSQLQQPAVEAEIQGPLEEIRTEWADALECMELSGGWVRIRFAGDSETLRTAVAARCASRGWKLRALQRHASTLEEHFVRAMIGM